jgi:hypothetical protein
MITSLDTHYAKVWIDEELSCIFTTIRSCIGNTELEFLEGHELDCLRRLEDRKQIFGVTDCYDYAGLSDDSLRSYVKDLTEREFNNGLVFKIFVLPKEPILRILFRKEILKHPDPNIKIAYTFQEAVSLVKAARRARRKTAKFSLSRLFAFLFSSQSYTFQTIKNQQ